MEEFAQRKSRVIPKDETTNDLMTFYDYTCQREDCVRSFTISSPNHLEKDLRLGKEFLKLLKPSCWTYVFLRLSPIPAIISSIRAPSFFHCQ